jgi:hypothetical protein
MSDRGVRSTLMIYSSDPRNKSKTKTVVDLSRTKRGFEPQPTRYIAAMENFDQELSFKIDKVA